MVCCLATAGHAPGAAAHKQPHDETMRSTDDVRDRLAAALLAPLFLCGSLLAVGAGCAAGREQAVNAASATADDDRDGIPDSQDPDNDDDGIIDARGDRPLDHDNDGIDDAVDPDDDNDGIPDLSDEHPLDHDNDGKRDSEDPDDDNDGILDTADKRPFARDEAPAREPGKEGEGAMNVNER